MSDLSQEKIVEYVLENEAFFAEKPTIKDILSEFIDIMETMKIKNPNYGSVELLTSMIEYCPSLASNDLFLDNFMTMYMIITIWIYESFI